MSIKLKLAGIAATGAILLAGASVSAFAASAQSDAFLANVRPNVNFLDLSSRMAIDKSSRAAIRSFAHAEAMEQTITGNSLVAWTQTNTLRGEAVAIGTPIYPVDPLSVAALPLNTAADVTYGVGDVLTGRSVAIDRPLTVTPITRRANPIGSQLLPSEQDDMTRLSMSSGRQFDALYKSTQLDALRQLATLYRDYGQNGDDPSLRAIAVRELPRITRRIAELRRL